MKSISFMALVSLLGVTSAMAQEEAEGDASLSASGSASTSQEAPVVRAAREQAAPSSDFTAPSGQLGAGLSTSAAEKLRFYGDLGFHLAFGRQEAFLGFGDDYHQSRWGLPLILGAGYKIMPNLELEGRFGIAAARLSVKSVGCNEADCKSHGGSFTPGNLFLGANYLIESGPWLAKVGGGIAVGPWSIDASNDRNVAYYYSGIMNLEDFWLFVPEHLTVVAPARVEYRLLPELALTGDASLAFYIPYTDGGSDPELAATLAPGAAYLWNSWMFGGRLPLFWMMTDDMAQFAVEPYARYDFGSMFVSGRFTFFLDNPYGTTFTEDSFWVLRAAFGATF